MLVKLLVEKMTEKKVSFSPFAIKTIRADEWRGPARTNKEARSRETRNVTDMGKTITYGGNGNVGRVQASEEEAAKIGECERVLFARLTAITVIAATAYMGYVLIRELIYSDIDIRRKSKIDPAVKLMVAVVSCLMIGIAVFLTCVAYLAFNNWYKSRDESLGNKQKCGNKPSTAQLA